MKRSRFISNGIAVDVFQPADQSSAELVGIYLYGFPGSIGEAAPTRLMLELGYTVLQPHYPGTYDSAGAFSGKSAIDMLKALSEAIANGKQENIKDGSALYIHPQITLCIGHSFGAFAALRGVAYLQNLTTLVLLGPVIAYGPGSHGCGLKEDGAKHVAYVRRSRPFTYRLDSDAEWESLYRGELDNQTIEAPKSLSLVHGIVGEQDKYFDHHQLNSRFGEIVTTAIKGHYRCQLETAPGAGHGPGDLLDAQKLKRLVT